jgi:hypothetical protein
MKRVVLVLTLTAIVALFVVGAASAAPVNSPNQLTVTYTCEGGEQVELLDAKPLNGPDARHEVGTNRIWEPMAGMARVTNLKTGEVREFQGTVPGQVEHNDLVRCTGSYTFEEFLVEETLFFLVTPQGGQD